MAKYVVIRDSREKAGKGWKWNNSMYFGGTVVRSLETGDYTLEGLEGYMVIERKGSISEWATNIIQPRFSRELERLDGFRFPWILLEFTMEQLMKYPVGSGIPRKKWKFLKMRGDAILRHTVHIMVKHRTQIVFCGDYGKEVATSIFKRTIEHVKANTPKS